MCAKVYAFCCFGGFQRGPAFIEELLLMIPNAQYYKRGTYDLKKIIEYVNKKEFTSLIVVHTVHREQDALLIISLPNGPTAHFKLSKLIKGVLTVIFFPYSLFGMPADHGNLTSHEPELVLNNFTTRLGHRIGRMDYLQAPIGFLLSPAFFRLTQSLFPQEPNFRGRRVVTFHNQRDFIFFRHRRCASFAIFSSCSDPFLYLYIFETKETKQVEVKGKKTKDSKADAITEAKPFARLQECGPRFTLELISLQHGTFDPRGGEFEWVHKVIHLSVNSFQYIGFISLS
ncbi:putative anticodon-binding, Brix domain-containing protein [Rosa chinensis]|uniref:Putative anticodon-binding, Brix domain-containing protein n=1 Tax=Rosa chinensis TaxID=74649 RepID=A0A2P6SF09_ROSCH|nr:putative anticodon-binding, Brix domain-containing protein [Rosa chinensis]